MLAIATARRQRERKRKGERQTTQRDPPPQGIKNKPREKEPGRGKRVKEESREEEKAGPIGGE